MKLDRLALVMVGIVAAVWIVMLLAGILQSPFGWVVLVIVALPAFILYRVFRERSNNADDDYSDKNVRQ